MSNLLHARPKRFSPEMVELREGIAIEKGAVLTEAYLLEHIELFEKYADFFTAYPDIFLDMIKPQAENFKLFFYQRIALRAMLRYKIVFICACRAFSKSFLTILALMLQCIFMPGTKRFICAPFKNQSAKIAKEKIVEIYDHWPLIRKEVVGGDITDTPGSFGKDQVTLNFKMVLFLMLQVLVTPLEAEEDMVA